MPCNVFVDAGKPRSAKQQCPSALAAFPLLCKSFTRSKILALRFVDADIYP